VTTTLPRAGDVVVTDFPGATGIKRRPAVVLSSDKYHETRPDAIIGVIESHLPAVTSSTDHVLLDWSEAGLRLPSAFRAYLMTVPRASLSARIGHLSERDWAASARLRENRFGEPRIGAV